MFPVCITQAIEYSQEALNLIPGGNSNRAGPLNNLSSHLSTRYEREGKLEDLTQATPGGNLNRAALPTTSVTVLAHGTRPPE